MASGKHLMAIIIVMVLVTAGVLGALVLMEPTSEDTRVFASFDSPSDGSTVTGLINVTANITSKSAISYALLKMDGVELGNRSTSPFFWNLNTTHYFEGQHILNLIAFNEFPGASYRTPAPEAVSAFQQILLDRHYTAILRASRGRDILAACGQLSGQAAFDNGFSAVK